MKNAITPEHEAQFTAYIVKWQGLLNLHDWRIQRLDKPAKGAMADVAMSPQDKLAQYRLGKHFGTEQVTPHSLEATAVHELLHVLLAEYREIAVSKPSDEILQGAEHRVIHTLERLLVPKGD